MRFSIRDLLWITVAIAIALGWWVDHRALTTESSSEAVALAALNDLRPTIRFDRRGKVCWLDLSERNSVSDGTLAYVGCFPELTELYLIDTLLSGDGFRHLRRLNKLKKLDLYGCSNVTDAGIEHLKKLQALEYLDLTGAKITDTALASLSALPRLETLRLGDTAVSDAGVQHLTKMQRLGTLELGSAPISDEGIALLRNALPQTEIAVIDGPRKREPRR